MRLEVFFCVQWKMYILRHHFGVAVCDSITFIYEMFMVMWLLLCCVRTQIREMNLTELLLSVDFYFVCTYVIQCTNNFTFILTFSETDMKWIYEVLTHFYDKILSFLLSSQIQLFFFYFKKDLLRESMKLNFLVFWFDLYHQSNKILV